jgi:hypothetical protein
MSSNRVIDVQLVDENERHIMTAGGQMFVLSPGLPDILSAFDINQAALTQPIAGNRGRFYAQVAKANKTVDVIIYSPTGHCRMIKNLTPGDRQTVMIDTSQLVSQWIIPASIAQATQAVEKDSGVDLPTGALVEPIGVGLDVIAADATEDIVAGILSTEPSGDADGFILNASVASTGSVRITALNGADNLGALLKVQDSVNAGDDFPAPHVVLSTSRSVSYTLSAGSDTVKAYINLPVRLSKVSDLTLQ